MSIPITIQPGTLPYAGGCYPNDPQQLNVDIIRLAVAFLAGNYAGLYISDSAPPADQRDKAWLKRSNCRIYLWNGSYGDWMREYDIPASSDVEQIWKGTEALLKTYGGGDAGAVGPASGPLWEIDHAIDGRVMVGPGTIPGSDPSGDILIGGTSDSNGNSGEWKHTLIQDELPKVDLLLAVKSGQADNLDNDSTEILCNPANTTLGTNPVTLKVPTGGNNDPFINAPPFIGRWVIKRTSRVYVKAPY